MILGRLVVSKKQRNRSKKEDAGKCRACKEPLPPGEYVVSIKKKVKEFWTTRQFHLSCFSGWVEYMVGYVQYRDTRRRQEGRAARGSTSVPRVMMTMELVQQRTAMLKRRSYLLRVLYGLKAELKVMDPEDPRWLKIAQSFKSTIREREDLAMVIDSIASYKPFQTDKTRIRFTEIGDTKLQRLLDAVKDVPYEGEFIIPV
jgi:hypothetical protein